MDLTVFPQLDNPVLHALNRAAPTSWNVGMSNTRTGFRGQKCLIPEGAAGWLAAAPHPGLTSASPASNLAVKSLTSTSKRCSSSLLFTGVSVFMEGNLRNPPWNPKRIELPWIDDVFMLTGFGAVQVSPTTRLAVHGGQFLKEWKKRIVGLITFRWD